MKSKKNILITGAFGGIGTALIDILLKDNWNIFAGDLTTDISSNHQNHPQITHLLFDVTNQKSIESAFEFISKKTQRLDAIVHTAGILMVGSMVEIPVSEIQHLLNVNLFGIYRVNQVFLPLLIKSKGSILIMSSETGTQTAAPFNGAYALSKHALEAYADSLRRELSFYDVKVIKFQPGAFKTTMTEQIEKLFSKAERKSTLFKKNISKGSSYLPKVYKKAHDPSVLAKKINEALNSKNPKTSYAVKQNLLRNFLEYLPVKWADKLIKRGLS